MPSFYTSFGSAATAWCFVWFPALFYLLYTRYPSASHAGVSSEHVQLWQASECAALSAVLYADRYACADSGGSRTERYLALQQALQLLWHADERTYQESLESNVPPVLLLDSTWRTDANGVSALLLAQVSDDGRLWQWHTGGGPIPIGRTLVMDQAGCRSAACDRSNGPLRGVGGLSTAPTTTPSSSNTDNDATLLVVAEWGERRIVRVEENGARTPLVIQVPSVEACQSSTSTTNRLHAPRHVTVTPQHDLFFVDSVAVGNVPSHHNDAAAAPPQDCFVVWHQARVDQIPALPTLADSRRAHTWTALPYHQPLLVPVYTSPTPIGGLAVVQDAVTLSSSLYVTTAWPAQGVVVLEISLDDDTTDEMISTTAETDDNDNDTATTHEAPVSPTTKAPRVLFRLQRHLPNALEPGPLVVTAQRTIFLGTNEGLAILLPNFDDTDGRLVDYRLAGLLPLAIMDRPRITSLTLGGDGYLYVTTESRLWRLKIRDDSL